MTRTVLQGGRLFDGTGAIRRAPTWPSRASGSSRGERTPPETATLITSAPFRFSSRTLCRT